MAVPNNAWELLYGDFKDVQGVRKFHAISYKRAGQSIAVRMVSLALAIVRGSLSVAISKTGTLIFGI